MFGCRWCDTDGERKDIVHTLFNRQIGVRDGGECIKPTRLRAPLRGAQTFGNETLGNIKIAGTRLLASKEGTSICIVRAAIA